MPFVVQCSTTQYMAASIAVWSLFPCVTILAVCVCAPTTAAVLCYCCHHFCSPLFLSPTQLVLSMQFVGMHEHALRMPHALLWCTSMFRVCVATFGGCVGQGNGSVRAWRYTHTFWKLNPELLVSSTPPAGACCCILGVHAGRCCFGCAVLQPEQHVANTYIIGVEWQFCVSVGSCLRGHPPPATGTLLSSDTVQQRRQGTCRCFLLLAPAQLFVQCFASSRTHLWCEELEGSRSLLLLWQGLAVCIRRGCSTCGLHLWPPMCTRSWVWCVAAAMHCFAVCEACVCTCEVRVCVGSHMY
jgi:hypothetical protein